MPRDPLRSPVYDGPFDTDFPARTDAIASARHAFIDWLGLIAPGSDTDDLSVVFSELAANAVAASGDHSGHVVARAGVIDGILELMVVNPDLDAPVLTDWDLDDPLRDGGRGLMIVRALVDELDVILDDGRVALRCRRQLEPST